MSIGTATNERGREREKCMKGREKTFFMALQEESKFIH